MISFSKTALTPLVTHKGIRLTPYMGVLWKIFTSKYIVTSTNTLLGLDLKN